MPLPFCVVNKMDEKEEFRERVPIAQWPELERKMGIISQMTSDPPLTSQQEMEPSAIPDEFESVSLSSEESAKNERNIPLG